MNTVKILIARIYAREKEDIVKPVLAYLKNVAKVRGLSVFRAIGGYGEDGHAHTSFLLDLSLDLPITIEFFDHPDIMNTALDYLTKTIKPEHIIFWEANANAALDSANGN